MASLQFLLREAAIRCRPRYVEMNRICSRCFRQHAKLSIPSRFQRYSLGMQIRREVCLSKDVKLVSTSQEGSCHIDKRTYSGKKLDKDSEMLFELKEKFVKEKSKFYSSTEGSLSEIERNELLENSSGKVLSDNDNGGVVGGTDNIESKNDPAKVRELINLKSYINTTSGYELQIKDDPNPTVIDTSVLGARLINQMATSQDPDSDSSESEGLLTDVESDSESSSSDEDSGDLFSDESSDDEGKFASKFGESEAVSDLDEMKKEGLTSEEMIELIEKFCDTESFSHKELSDYPNIEIATEIKPKDNTNLLHGDTVMSAPSRHFDESGVISLIDHDMDKVKSSSKDWSAEEIEDFVNIANEEVDELWWQPPVSLQRGLEGVFDIQELVKLLQVENIKDLVTIRIPPEKNFGDYMVVGTAKSFRHLSAVSENLNWIYKQRKFETERFLKQEGKKENSGWIAIDLGNIILHLFLPDEREMYDLETLWTVGSKYDSHSLEEDDPYALSVDDHPWLKELEELKSRNVNK